MRRPTLSRGALTLIHEKVDTVFDRLKMRVLGPGYVGRLGDKQLVVHREKFSIPGIYRQATFEEYTKPNETLLHSLTKVAEGYLDSERERTKARVTAAVTSWIQDSGRKDGGDISTVLGGELSKIWGQTMSSVVKIVNSESTGARNLGTLEGITKVNAIAGVEDPAVFFIIVRDGDACDECKRLHLLDDGLTPRVWRLSEVSSGYHTRGAPTPCFRGLHPECRCTLSTLMPGYGFTDKGFVRFVALDHDEFAKQRESEPE